MRDILLFGWLLKLNPVLISCGHKEGPSHFSFHVLGKGQPSPEAFSLDPLSAQSVGETGRENGVLGEYLSVTSQFMVESRNQRAENAWGLGWVKT